MASLSERVEHISHVSLLEFDQLGEGLLGRPAQHAPAINEARERHREPQSAARQAQIGGNLINEAHSMIGTP